MRIIYYYYSLSPFALRHLNMPLFKLLGMRGLVDPLLVAHRSQVGTVVGSQSVRAVTFFLQNELLKTLGFAGLVDARLVVHRSQVGVMVGFQPEGILGFLQGESFETLRFAGLVEALLVVHCSQVGAVVGLEVNLCSIFEVNHGVLLFVFFERTSRIHNFFLRALKCCFSDHFSPRTPQVASLRWLRGCEKQDSCLCHELSVQNSNFLCNFQKLSSRCLAPGRTMVRSTSRTKPLART